MNGFPGAAFSARSGCCRCGHAVRAQQTPPAAQSNDAPTFSTGVKVVEPLRERPQQEGRNREGSTKDDFLLDEDGVPQADPLLFAGERPAAHLGAAGGYERQPARLIDEERAASYRFFEQVLREEKDVAFVIHFDFDVELLQDLTSSRKLLEQALENLEAPQQLRRNRPQGGGYPGGGGGDGGQVPGGGACAEAEPICTTQSCWQATNS